MIKELLKENRLIGAVLVLKDGYELEANMDEGMLGRVVAVLSEEDYIAITLDIREFEEYNKEKALPTFFDKDGYPTLKWHQTGFYPEDLREELYIAPSLLDQGFAVADQQEINLALQMQGNDVFANTDFKALGIKFAELALMAHEITKDEHSDEMKKDLFGHLQAQLRQITNNLGIK